jgi:hypothetical protein
LSSDHCTTNRCCDSWSEYCIHNHENQHSPCNVSRSHDPTRLKLFLQLRRNRKMQQRPSAPLISIRKRKSHQCPNAAIISSVERFSSVLCDNNSSTAF